MSDSAQSHGLQPTRLLHPWDFPGKNPGVGCSFLLQCMKVKSESEVAQSCLTLIDPMDCSLLGSSVHGIFQARVLEWGAIALSTPINSTVQIVVKLKGDSSVGLEASDPTRERERGQYVSDFSIHRCLDLLSAAWLGYEYFPFDAGVLEELQESL